MTGPEPSFGDFLKENFWLFFSILLGIGLFTVGIYAVINAQDAPETEESLAGEVGSVRLGPGPGDELAPYIAEKQDLLRRMSAALGSRKEAAVISFGAYEGRSMVTDISDPGVEIVFMMVRVPLEGFLQETVDVAPDPPLTQLSRWRRRALKDHMDELAALRDILPTIKGADFRKTYLEDIELNQMAVDLLEEGDPKVVYALVVNAELDHLKSMSEREGVRLVDISSQRRGVQSFQFVGLLPEWVEVVPEAEG